MCGQVQSCLSLETADQQILTSAVGQGSHFFIEKRPRFDSWTYLLTFEEPYAKWYHTFPKSSLLLCQPWSAVPNVWNRINAELLKFVGNLRRQCLTPARILWPCGFLLCSFSSSSPWSPTWSTQDCLLTSKSRPRHRCLVTWLWPIRQAKDLIKRLELSLQALLACGLRKLALASTMMIRSQLQRPSFVTPLDQSWPRYSIVSNKCID